MPDDTIETSIKELGDIAKLHIKLHQNPEKLLRRILQDSAEMFIPRNTDQSVDFCKEFIRAGAKYGAWILRDHVKDHPEGAKKCCMEILDFLVEIYRIEIQDSFAHLCEWDSLDNPFDAVEQTLNEKTTAAILKEIEDA